jgi:hypothetical protein
MLSHRTYPLCPTEQFWSTAKQEVAPEQFIDGDTPHVALAEQVLFKMGFPVEKIASMPAVASTAAGSDSAAVRQADSVSAAPAGRRKHNDIRTQAPILFRIDRPSRLV